LLKIDICLCQHWCWRSCA